MKRAAVVWAVPALIVCLAFTSLGVWQLQRGQWKERLLAGWDAALAEAPRDYTSALAGRSALPRREDLATPTTDAALPLPTTLRGRWDPTTTLLLDNQRLDAAIGVFVLTRFVPVDGGVPLLVNRGWLPLPPDRTPPAIPAPADSEVALRGLLVATPAAGIKLAAPAWSPGQPPPLLTALDIEALRAVSGSLFDGVMQLDPAAADGFTRRWRPLPNTLPPQKHRGYAVQWFGLATAVAIIYLLLAFRRP